MRKLLILWLLGWALFGLPWTTFTLHPTFDRISLAPFKRTRRRDQLLNFAYYIPFGAATALLGWHPGAIVGSAGLLSGATEFIQLFSTDRVTSLTDVLLNVGGAIVGAAVVIFMRQRMRSSA
jgi:VanZ family protein